MAGGSRFQIQQEKREEFALLLFIFSNSGSDQISSLFLSFPVQTHRHQTRVTISTFSTHLHYTALSLSIYTPNLSSFSLESTSSATRALFLSLSLCVCVRSRLSYFPQPAVAH